MPRVYVSIGSNVDREANIRSAVAALRRCFEHVVLSAVFETDPVGFEGENFFNLVAGFDTEMGVEDVAAALADIEQQHARRRDGPRFGPRSLDLDLLLYNDVVMNAGRVRLPREDITKYAFVLGPLAEIAGAERHPVSGRTYDELWAAFEPRARDSLRRVNLRL